MANALSETISGLLNAAPVSFDPEDDIHQETTARVVSKDAEEDGDEDLIGKFRKQNVALLEDVDQRYKGKRGTRKKLVQNDWGSEEDSDTVPDAKSDTEEESNDAYSDTDEDAAGNSDSSSSSIEDNNEDKDATFTHIEEPDVSLQIQKGQCVRQQLSIWENLLEMRIQFQKCLIAANRFSLPSAADEFKQNGGTKLGSTRKSLTNLLDKLLYLQLLLVRKYPETKSLLLGKTQTYNTNDEDNEEIPSGTEEEQGSSNSDAEELPKKKRKLNYLSEISKRHSSYKNYRDSVIQKWNDKTKTVTTKTTNATHSVLKQIEHILNDKDKLIKRTQINRIDNGDTTKSKEFDSSTDDLYNPEVFDDTDFYHQLLRELIEYKSADLTDPVQLGRQWVQLQSLRSKMKRRIDTRATKGRKIRYAVHSKLVNFMAPVEDITWQSDTKTELYSSLFGKNQPVNKI